MNCPRCNDSVLDEKDREGVTIEICRECRGVWLDRGELEKIIARAAREMESDERRGSRRDDDDDDDDDDDSRDRGRFGKDGGPPRKRSWFESLGEMFD